jgi:uncharacterized protein YbcI
MSSDAAPTAEAIKAEISRELIRVHEESYGEGATNLDVALHDTFVVVVLDVLLSPAERTLIEAGNEDSVTSIREAFQVAIETTFTAIIERATGRRVTGFASRMVVHGPGPPWSVEVFRLGEPAVSPRP